MFYDYLVGITVDPRTFCGLLAGVLSTLAYMPYMADTALGRTRPERATWLIWSVVASIAMLSQIYEGAGHSLWFVGVQVSATLVIFFMSIWFGDGAYLSRRNIRLFGIVSLGLVVWYYADNALYMLLVTTGISVLGGSVTVLKAYRDPDSETLSTWILSLVAAFLAIVSVGQLDLALMIYPAYLYILYSAIVVAILLGRAHGNRRVVTFTLPAASTPATAASVVPTGVVVHDWQAHN